MDPTTNGPADMCSGSYYQWAGGFVDPTTQWAGVYVPWILLTNWPVDLWILLPNGPAYKCHGSSYLMDFKPQQEMQCLFFLCKSH